MEERGFVFSCFLLYNDSTVIRGKGISMKKGISQEGLKLIACFTMLIDHIGYEIIYPVYSGMSIVSATDLPQVRMVYRLYLLCRCIGRIAFPIFAFLLVEGFHHTRSRKKYALRLVLGVLLAEIPYNLMVSGQAFWQQQSVMVTLLLGFCAVWCMDRFRSLAWKPVVMLPFALLAELMMTDYGWAGVVLVALFELSRQMYSPNLIRTGGMIVLFHHMSSYVFQVGNFALPMQVLGVLAMVFIANYRGEKRTHNPVAQWAFYLFYPVHMLILWAIGTMIPQILLLGISIAA